MPINSSYQTIEHPAAATAIGRTTGSVASTLNDKAVSPKIRNAQSIVANKATPWALDPELTAKSRQADRKKFSTTALAKCKPVPGFEAIGGRKATLNVSIDSFNMSRPKNDSTSKYRTLKSPQSRDSKSNNSYHKVKRISRAQTGMHSTKNSRGQSTKIEIAYNKVRSSNQSYTRNKQRHYNLSALQQ